MDSMEIVGKTRRQASRIMAMGIGRLFVVLTGAEVLSHKQKKRPDVETTDYKRSFSRIAELLLAMRPE
jgi:hypothetical protein